MCPHKKAFVLSRGIIGNQQDIPKVSCPLHKKNFSLKTGECISGEDYSIETFPVRIDGNNVILELAPEEILDGALSTTNFCSTGCAAKCTTV